MNRSGLALSGTIAIIGAARILFPEQVTGLFSLDISVAVIAIFIALVGYSVWLGPFNFLSGSWLMRLAGFAIFAFGLLSINSPTLLGARENYLPIADIFLFVESGILLQMIGMERKTVDTLMPVTLLNTVGHSINSKLRRPGSSVSVSTTTR